MKIFLLCILSVLLSFSLSNDSINSEFNYINLNEIYLGDSFTYLNIPKENYTLIRQYKNTTNEIYLLNIKIDKQSLLTLYNKTTEETEITTCKANNYSYQSYSSMLFLCEQGEYYFNITFSSSDTNNLTVIQDNKNISITLTTNTSHSSEEYANNITFIHYATQDLLSKEAKIYGNILILLGLFIALYGIYYENLTIVILINTSSFVFIEKALELFSIDLDTIMFQLVLITVIIIGSFLGALLTSHNITIPIFGFHFGLLISKLFISYILNLILYNNYQKKSGIIKSMQIIICSITLTLSIVFGFLWKLSHNQKVINFLKILTVTSFGSYMIVYGISLFTGGVSYDSAFYTLFSEHNSDKSIKNWNPYKGEMSFLLILFATFFCTTFVIQFILHRIFDAQYYCTKNEDKQVEESDADDIEDNNQDEIIYQKPKEKLIEKGKSIDGSYLRNTIRNSNSNNTYDEGRSSLNPEGGE